MRIPRTGLALLCAAALAGCQRSETPAAPNLEPVAAPTARESHNEPFFAKPDDWFTNFPKHAAGRLEDEPAPMNDSIPRMKVHPDPASAISALIAANDDFVPESGEELVAALKSIGEFVQLPVSFSAVALDSGLAKPRIVFAARSQAVAAANRPNPSGRLFLAANLAASDRDFAPPRVSTIEFISWNSRRLKFDFGVIEMTGDNPGLKFLDGVRCFTCHKNHGPILGVKPWSNTMHNTPVIDAAAQRLGLKKQHLIAGGIPIADPNAEAVDSSVRLAAETLLERKTVQALAKSPTGRTALARIMVTLAQPGELPKLDPQTARLLDEADLRRYFHDAFMIQKTATSSKLIDPDPQGLLGPAAGGVNWWGGLTPRHFLDFDDLRAAGEHRMSEKFVPSNPQAFEKRPFKMATRASDTVDGAMLMRVLGLTSGDRAFLADSLADAAAAAEKWTGRPVATRGLAERTFTSKAINDMLASGAIPDRDEFKDVFVAGLGEALHVHGYTGKYWAKRERYAVGPAIAAGTDRIVAEVLPTTACLGCHDIAKPGIKLAFNPIPPLPFDPFDVPGRTAWVKANGGRGKESLARMLKRLGRDMPPSDSAEHAMFREKNPEMFRAASEFLEKELRK